MLAMKLHTFRRRDDAGEAQRQEQIGGFVGMHFGIREARDCRREAVMRTALRRDALGGGKALDERRNLDFPAQGEPEIAVLRGE